MILKTGSNWFSNCTDYFQAIVQMNILKGEGSFQKTIFNSFFVQEIANLVFVLTEWMNEWNIIIIIIISYQLLDFIFLLFHYILVPITVVFGECSAQTLVKIYNKQASGEHLVAVQNLESFNDIFKSTPRYTFKKLFLPKCWQKTKVYAIVNKYWLNYWHILVSKVYV